MNLPYQPTIGGYCDKDGKKCVLNWFLGKINRETDSLGFGYSVLGRINDKFNRDLDPFMHSYTQKEYDLGDKITKIIFENDNRNYKNAFLMLYNLLNEEINWFMQYAPESINVLKEMKAVIEEYKETEECPILTSSFKTSLDYIEKPSTKKLAYIK